MLAAWALFAIGGLAVLQAGDLHRIQDIRDLRLESDPVEPIRAAVTARVTYIANWNGRSQMTVQDASAGIYTIADHKDTAQLRLGDDVIIRGKVQKGNWAPCLVAEEITASGKKELPAPVAAGFSSLKSGGLDSQFVELEGIIRDAQYDPNVTPPSTVLSLAMKGGALEVYLAGDEAVRARALVDSTVRLTGVPFHYFNQRNQVFGVRIMVAELSQIKDLGGASPDPFGLPLSEIGTLLQYKRQEDPGHRVRVRGEVTLHHDKEFFYLQDGLDGLLVRSRQTETLVPGDQVDVVAFATMGTYAAYLDKADFRKIGHYEPRAARKLTIGELHSGQGDSTLVRTEGTLERISERNGSTYLIIGNDGFILGAELPGRLENLSGIAIGSRVSLTGVSEVDVGSERNFARYNRPESAHLLLRNEGDIEVIEAPPWWDARRLRYLALGMLGIFLLAVLWAGSLRAKNSRLKREIAGRHEAEMKILQREEEHKILAADLHDTLEQSLTGLAFQLRAADDSNTSDHTNPHLALAEKLLEHSRAEVHRAVRDIRKSSEEPFDLKWTIERIPSRWPGAEAGFIIDVSGGTERVPTHLGYQVLHVIQEAVTNALKHARPSSVSVTLEIKATYLRLSVADDGRGFDVADSPGPSEGHFGLQGMRERISRLKGAFTVESSPSGGTTIEANIPLGE